jgi:hypothetical protein
MYTRQSKITQWLLIMRQFSKLINPGRPKILTVHRDLFEEYNLVYVQGTDSESDWTSLESCVWEGEAFMKTRTPLALLSGYRDKKRLVRLFQDILELPNAGLQDYLEEIRHRQEEDADLEDIPDIYHSLWENITEEELPKLR